MSRPEWAISGLLGLLIVVAVAAFAFSGIDHDTSTSARTASDLIAESSSAGHSARSAYELVAAPAREWAADAQLLSANATWPAGTRVTPNAASWGFQFYSATQQSTALFAVTGDSVRLVRNSKTNGPLAPLNSGGWLVDSPEVLEILMANGGDQFLGQQHNTSLTLTLSLIGELEWQARLIDLGTNEVVAMTINPTNGAVEAPILPTGGE